MADRTGICICAALPLLDIEKTAGKLDEDDEYTYMQQWTSFHQQVCLQNPEQDKNAIIFGNIIVG